MTLLDNSLMHMSGTALCIVLFCTCAGDIAVLIGIHNQKILTRTSATTVFLLKYITGSTLGICLTIILPASLALVAGRQIFQHVFCSLQGSLGQFFLSLLSSIMALHSFDRMTTIRCKGYHNFIERHVKVITIVITVMIGCITSFSFIDLRFYTYVASIHHCTPTSDTIPMIWQYAAHFPFVITIVLSVITLVQGSSPKFRNRVHFRHGSGKETDSNPVHIDHQPIKTLSTQNKRHREYINSLSLPHEQIPATQPTVMRQRGLSKNEVKSSKAFSCIYIPISIFHLASFAFKLAIDHNGVYGTISIVCIVCACALYPLISLLISKGLRQCFLNSMRQSQTKDSRAYNNCVHNLRPREEHSDAMELPEFLRPKSNLTLKVEFVTEGDSNSLRSFRRLSQISINSDGISIIDLDECLPNNEKENSDSINSLLCQVDSQSHTPSITSPTSNVALNVVDLQRLVYKANYKLEKYSDAITPSPIFHEFGTRRTLSMPSMSSSHASPRSPQTAMKLKFKRKKPQCS